jgi:hypothetical protein
MSADEDHQSAPAQVRHGHSLTEILLKGRELNLFEPGRPLAAYLLMPHYGSGLGTQMAWRGPLIPYRLSKAQVTFTRHNHVAAGLSCVLNLMLSMHGSHKCIHLIDDSACLMWCCFFRPSLISVPCPRQDAKDYFFHHRRMVPQQPHPVVVLDKGPLLSDA